MRSRSPRLFRPDRQATCRLRRAQAARRSILTLSFTSPIDSERIPSVALQAVQLVEYPRQQCQVGLRVGHEVLGVPPQVQNPAPTCGVAQPGDDAVVLERFE